MAKKKKTNKQVFSIDWRVIFALQVITSAVLFLSVYRLGALPTLYLSVVGAILVLMNVIMAFMMKPNKRKVRKQQLRKLFAKILSILLSIVMTLGCLYIEKGISVLDMIAGANKKTTRFQMIVLADNEAESIQDLGETEYAYCALNDKPIHLSEVIGKIEEANSLLSSYTISDYQSLVSQLYQGEVEAILVNEAYRGLVEDEYPSFDSETKVIWYYDIVEEMEDISKSANVTKETFTIYISGIDTTGSISTVSRSDVNMLVTVNPVSKQILLTSIPRDYFVPMADSGINDKLTHAGLGGVENSIRTIENFMNIDINYYIRVNFTSLETIVDALGGITVDSPYAFTTYHGGYWINQGLNDMDGHKALCFVRERFSLPNGDNDRVKNQQLVLMAMLEKAMSPTIITNYTDILDAAEGAFETNMTSDDIMSLIRMQLDDMASWTFNRQTLEGYGAMLTGGAYSPYETLYYTVPYEESISECSSLIQQMTGTNE